MTLSRTLLPLALLSSLLPLAAQSPNAQPAAPAQPSPSAMLEPALASVNLALSLARPEKWKAPSQVTAESASDLDSIQRDLNSTLPPLVSAADSGSMPQLLAAYRNVEALYDVLVRVTQTSVLAAPAQQSVALQQATQNLQQARRSFADLLDSAAQAQERRLTEVRQQLTRLQSAPPPPAPVCPPPPAPKKPIHHARPKPKPTSTPQSTTAPKNQ